MPFGLDKALNGQPQFIFITGEPGIGKTTLIDRFWEQLQIKRTLTIGRGQCVEQYGEGEAYLPILEAMSRLCRDGGGQEVVTLLRQYAPTWLVQLPGIIDETEAQTLRLQVQGATQQRMLREMAEVIAAGTTRRPLVLILEDLHWSDQATVELLSYLAQRRERAQFLVIGTYRPADLVTRNHPLKAIKQELHAKGLCEELRVELLSTQAVNDYLSKRFPQQQFPSDLAVEIHRRTEGNALFMVNVVEELLQQGRIVEEGGRWLFQGDLAQSSVPDTLRQLIEKQVQQRSEAEQRLLEVASVVGTEFAVAAVAAVLKHDLDEVEEACENLVWQGHFLEEKGVAEWPDGTVSGRYSFRHALYQNVLYERIAEARRIRLHRAIGERLETGYGERASEIAAELAVHFEQGRDYSRAISYRQQAAQTALACSAYAEAIDHLTKGLASLKTLPDTPERDQQEIGLQIALGSTLMASKGWAAPEVENAYVRARELCQRIGESPQLFWALLGVCGFYHQRAELQTASELAEQCLRMAQSMRFDVAVLLSRLALGATLHFMGELSPAREQLEQGVALYDPERCHSIQGALQDLGVGCCSQVAQVLWLLGYPDQALKRNQEALALARKLSHPFSTAYALGYASRVHELRKERRAAEKQVEAQMILAHEHGFELFLSREILWRGRLLTEQGRVKEGVAEMRQGLAAFRATGAELGGTLILAWLAEAYQQAGQVEEGLKALTEALAQADSTKERFYEAELHRLKGELTLQLETRGSGLGTSSQAPQAPRLRPLDSSEVEAEAEACFLKAIELAQHQQAKSWELRATTSLARLWRQQGKRREAHTILSDVYNWFTEGFDTKDLQEAKALIEELSH